MEVSPTQSSSRKQIPGGQAYTESRIHGDWISCVPPHRSVKCVFSQISSKAPQLVCSSEKAFQMHLRNID